VNFIVDPGSDTSIATIIPSLDPLCPRRRSGQRWRLQECLAFGRRERGAACACFPKGSLWGKGFGIVNSMISGAIDTAYNFCFVTKDLVLGSNDHKN
jgi:hypothetical protein